LVVGGFVLFEPFGEVFGGFGGGGEGGIGGDGGDDLGVLVGAEEEGVDLGGAEMPVEDGGLGVGAELLDGGLEGFAGEGLGVGLGVLEPSEGEAFPLFGFDQGLPEVVLADEAIDV